MEVGIWHEAASRKNAALTNAYIRARKRSGWRLQHDTSGFFKLRSYGEFSTRLQELCTEYSEKGLARLVTEKLYPHMDHILKLSLGITSAVQSCPYAPICWGAFLLVIYCGCSFAESLEAIIDQLSELERAIGYMEYDLHLYPMCKMQLQKPLCALFQDYLDFCIVIVEWMGHSVLANLSKALYSSALSRKLRPIKKSIEQNCKRFDQLVQKVSQTQTAELYRTVTGRCNLTADPVTFPLFEVRLQRNPDFVGRANQLSQLQQYLIRDGSQPKLVSCALEGVGGIGKTETALEFCYQQSCHYDAVFWVSAASQATLQTDFARIGRSLHLFDIEDDKVAAREIQVVLRWFQNEARRWLLVFDNVEDWHSIKKYWPCGSSAFGSIVATTQIRSTVEWTDHQIAIDPFEPAEGAELFLRKLRITNAGEKERAEACRLAELRAGIPLWMNFLAADIKNSPYSPEVWLEESNRGSPSKIEQTYRRESTRYERPPQEIFDNVLRSLSDDAKSLLYMLVFLNGDSIQEHILLAEHHCEELAFLNPKHRGRQAITELFRAWLLQRQDDHLSGGPILRIHRLTQEVLFERLSSDTETRQLALERVVQLIRECYPEPSKLMRPAEGTAALAFAVLPHILRTKSFFTMADPPMEGNIQLARLLIDVGNMDLYDNGRIADALSILELAEAILDRLGAPENNDCRGHILTVRGLCYDELGISKRHEGLRIRERCRSVRQQCFAQIPPDKADQEDEILLFNALTDYACSLQHANRFAEVEAICLQCIAQYRKWGPETDPALAFEYAKYYNHMAYVHLFRGDNAKAVGHARKGYEFMFRSQSNTQISLLFRFDWANVLFQTGNLDEAIRQHKIILQLRRDLCGEHNMRILQSHLNLGIILFFAKRFADACHHLKAVRQDTIAEWPIENKTRAGYYLGRSLLALDPMSMEGLNMRAESLRTMRRLLATDFLVESMGFAHDDEELLMDYLVEWELRLVTPHHSRPY